MTLQNRVEMHMTDYPCLVTSDVTAREAVSLMERHRIRHLPVMDEDRIIGVVTDRDLKQVELFADCDDLPVADLMTREPYCVSVGTPLSTVAETMAREKYGCTVVMSRSGRVVGVFTTVDGMRLLSELLESGDPEFNRAAPIETFLAVDGDAS